MLLIQEVNLTWHKEERGGAAAAARSNFPLAYPWPVGRELPNVVLHTLNFFQHGRDFLDLFQETRQSMAKTLPALGMEPPEVERRISQRIWQLKKYENQHFQSVDELNLANLGLEYCGQNLEVVFAYDEHRSGQPRRRGRNKDYHNRQSRLCGCDFLNETAFLLEPGQYGRVLWNERHVDCDTGGWYYQLHIYNILCWARGLPPADVLAANSPDFEYKQLADLY